MNFPDHLRYAKSHEWFDPNTGRVGISEHAQSELGDVVYLDFAAEVGEAIDAGATLGTVESVKTVSDIYAPVAGELVACNDAIQDSPELVNTDPYGDGWLFQLKATAGLADSLMDAAAYRAHIGVA